MSINSIDLHPSNNSSSTFSNIFGKRILRKFTQSLNAPFPIICTESGTNIYVNDVQALNAPSAILTTESGIINSELLPLYESNIEFKIITSLLLRYSVSQNASSPTSLIFPSITISLSDMHS